MTIVTISNHGRITIPKEIRKKIGLKDGDKVVITYNAIEGISIVPFIPEDKLIGILDHETARRIIKAVSEERKREVKIELERESKK